MHNTRSTKRKKSLNLCDKNTPWLYMRTDTVTDCEKYNYEKKHLGSDS